MSISQECAYVANMVHYELFLIVRDFENYIVNFEQNYLKRLEKLFNPFEKQMQNEFNYGVRTLIKVILLS